MFWRPNEAHPRFWRLNCARTLRSAGRFEGRAQLSRQFAADLARESGLTFGGDAVVFGLILGFVAAFGASVGRSLRRRRGDEPPFLAFP